MKLNLACGDVKIDGYIGVDIKKTDACDRVMDLQKFPWDFEDNSVDEIICTHYVEHTPDLIKFMDECYRILKPAEFDPKLPNKPISGFMTIVAPYYTSMRCWQDPTHLRAISEASFLYFNKKWREMNKLEHYDIKCDFDYSYGYNLDPYWACKNTELQAYAIKHYNNVVTDISVQLIKKT
jgi:SAM-dependent methyltransferase